MREKFRWSVPLDIPGQNVIAVEVESYWSPVDEGTPTAIMLAAKAETYMKMGRPKNQDGSPLNITPMGVERI